MTTSPSGRSQSTEHSHPDTTTTQFRYPQLLIEASFESLLSHSQSTERGAAAQMPRSEVSLSESWSSLSEHDLSHEDDLHSEATDTGSLIDVSTAGDVHTVNDHGDASDIDEDNHSGSDDEDEDEAAECNARSKQEYLSIKNDRSEYTNSYSQESLVLEDSTVFVDRHGTTSLQVSKSFTDAEIRSSTASIKAESFPDEMTGLIEMSLSNENLRLGDRPYHILYYGSTLSSSEIKADVLGKIGAALISSNDHHKLDNGSESPCYHVVPSEFGPGSRPSTADLIPIPVQMHVSECTVSGAIESDTSMPAICLDLNTGKRVVSRKARFYEGQNVQQWTLPDLIVVVISQNEPREGRQKAEQVVEFANRHQIALLCLRQEAGWNGDSFLTDGSPHMLHKSVHSTFSETADLDNRMLLDVNTFLALDSGQLNQHLNFITNLAKNSKAARSGVVSTIQAFAHRACCEASAILPRQLTGVFGIEQHRAQPLSECMIEVTSTLPSTTQQEEDKAANPLFVWTSKERAFILTALCRVAMVVGISTLTMFLLYTYQAFGSYRVREIGSSPNVTMACVTTTLSTLSAPPIVPKSTTSSKPYALSGPLQVLEQQVQSWMPVKKDVKAGEPSLNAVAETDEHFSACPNLVPAHLSPNLKVNPSFFNSGDPTFEVRVRRGKDRVSVKIEKQADGVVAVMIKRKDCYGKLTVTLIGGDEHTCALLDLEDSIGETLTLWIKSLRTNDPQLKSVKKFAKEFANEYTRIIVVRTAKPGLVNSAIELQYSAVRGIGAAVEAVEKTAVKQAKVCHQNKNECFVHKLGFSKDTIRAAHQARQISEDFIRNTRQQISDTTKQARHRANEAAEQAKGEISKAVQVVQTSIGELVEIRKVWPNKATVKLAEAQQRARKLVKKSRSGCKKRRSHK